MKIKLTLIAFAISFLSFSCKSEYKKTDNGALMKFYEINKENGKPEIGDLVLVDVTQKIGDSVLLSSEMISGPFEVLIEEPSFVGDFMCGLMSMHENDSASLIFSIDSIFLSIGAQIPEYIEKGAMTEMNIRLNKIIKKEILEEEYRKEMILRKNNEISALAPYYNDDEYEITEDSLIIVNNYQGDGKYAKAGNIMKVYFTFQTLEGDTVLDFRTGNPYELVFGDMALGQGFYEALSLVEKGGNAEFVIPSSLAFGKDGLSEGILPYTAFKLNIEVVDIMTSEEYEAEEKAIKEKRLEEEPIKIAKYIEENNITVQPQSSGLYYIETQIGTGDSVQMGDKISVHYSIYNMDNQLIETSYDYGYPLPFVLGSTQMLPCITEAVGYMRVGGKARIIAPSRLGFDDVNIDVKLPSYTPIVIDLELVDLYR